MLLKENAVSPFPEGSVHPSKGPVRMSTTPHEIRQGLHRWKRITNNKEKNPNESYVPGPDTQICQSVYSSRERSEVRASFFPFYRRETEHT